MKYHVTGLILLGIVAQASIIEDPHSTPAWTHLQKVWAEMLDEIAEDDWARSQQNAAVARAKEEQAIAAVRAKGGKVAIDDWRPASSVSADLPGSARSIVSPASADPPGSARSTSSTGSRGFNLFTFPSSHITSLPTMGLFGLLVSSGVTFTVLRFRRGASFTTEEPLLTSCD